MRELAGLLVLYKKIPQVWATETVLKNKKSNNAKTKKEKKSPFCPLQEYKLLPPFVSILPEGGPFPLRDAPRL